MGVLSLLGISFVKVGCIEIEHSLFLSVQFDEF